MKLFARCSIPTKLVWISIIAVLAALLLACAGFLSYELTSYYTKVYGIYEEEATLIGKLCARPLLSRDVYTASELLTAFESNPSIRAICIYDSNGQGFARYLRKDQPGNYNFPRVQLEGSWINGDQIEVFKRITSSEEIIGTVYLVADIEGVEARLWQYGGVIFIVLIASAGLAFTLAYFLHPIISRPVQHLAKTAKEVATKKDYSIRAKKETEDELGNLVESFNWMLLQIQLREQELKKSKDELEARVQERTAELVQINEKLQKEILERQKAEEALRNSQQKLLLHIQQTPLGVIDWTLDKRAINWNPSAERIFGFTENEVIGKTATQLIILQEKSEEFNKYWDDLLARRASPMVRMENRTKDGKIIICEWFNTLLTNREGVAIGVASLVLDITQRVRAEESLKKSEEHLRRTQKMEAVGQLAAGIAHDFNNVLTIVQGHISVLLAGRTLEPDVAERLQKVYDAAARAANMVKQLLTFSRKQEIQLKLTSINEIVSDITKLIRQVLGEDIKIEVDLDETIPFVKADAGLLDQVLINMALNARDAMPGGGRLSFRTRRVLVAEQIANLHPGCSPGFYACLTVADTGCGMDDVTRQRIFEPFFTTKAAGKGTGLGLSVAYGIVRQHGGWIDVESAPGKGTEFRIFLPCVEAEPVKGIVETGIIVPDENLRGHETILVVEDEPALRQLIGGILQFYGYKVYEVNSGIEALNIWQKHSDNIDLLLTDMILPEGMTGRELAQRLKELKPQLKIIYTSGYNIDSGINEFTLKEGYMFLAKPYHPKTLLQVIRLCLDGISNDAKLCDTILK